MEEDELRAANAAYYRAFAARDLAAMEAIWAADEVSCVHPGWPPLLGRVAIIGSYRDIFRNPSQPDVSPRDEAFLVSADDGRVFCIEATGGALLAATNWFRRISGVWRLVHHQAGPLAVQTSAAPSPAPSRAFH